MHVSAEKTNKQRCNVTLKSYDLCVAIKESIFSMSIIISEAPTAASQKLLLKMLKHSISPKVLRRKTG